MNGQSPLTSRYRAVLERIAQAERAAGRTPGSVSLLAVSKTFPAEDVAALAALGQRAFGENYLQEGQAKVRALSERLPDQPLQWHFIGPIQSNKTRPIAEDFDWVHSVDREKIARRLSEQRPTDRPPLQVCLQVNVSGEESKSGCAPDEVVALARSIAQMPRLRLRGLMAIPEPTNDPAVQRARFAKLRELSSAVQAEGLPLDTLSMGMSDDLEAAIAEGSTMVRVGSALFGARPRGGAPT